MKSVNIEVNGRELQGRKGETILEALKRAGIQIPTLCHMEGLPPSGACRICVVEIEGRPGLVPSCAFPIAEGMKILTHSQRVLRARKTIVELLLTNHPDDCLYCVRNGSCQLQDLAENLGVRERRYGQTTKFPNVDASSSAIIRDPAKCILCGRCVRVCEEVQGVGAIDFIGRGSRSMIGAAFDEGLNKSSCVNCGQCIAVCPTGALRERSYVKEVMDAIADPDKFVVVQHAPSISVTLAEEFGLPAGQDVCGVMTAAMRRLGFDRVFDTAFAADLTIMEEASELVHRIKTNGPLPMLTSCSPGWIKFAEEFYPEFIPNISTCKSPQQMMGAVIKTFFAERENLDPAQIYSVSIMPCTAKKFEAGRPEMSRESVPDVDAVLTTREFARVIRMYGLDLKALSPEMADTPFGERTTAGKIFGASGGVMEAAVRTAYWMITGENLNPIEVKTLRGMDGLKTAHVQIGDLKVGVAVANGLSNARKILDEIRGGRDDIHFVEVMTCPGGCIAGGGQPLNADLDAVRARMQALYRIDRTEAVHVSHENVSVQKLYDEFLGEPLGEKSHHLLHTHYVKREVVA